MEVTHLNLSIAGGECHSLFRTNFDHIRKQSHYVSYHGVMESYCGNMTYRNDPKWASTSIYAHHIIVRQNDLKGLFVSLLAFSFAAKGFYLFLVLVVSKILKPVLLQRVTPVTCYWILCLILRVEEELTLIFKACQFFSFDVFNIFSNNLELAFWIWLLMNLEKLDSLFRRCIHLLKCWFLCGRHWAVVLLLDLETNIECLAIEDDE
ncbi:hypothetical protein LINPERPRIM_LOCUS29595 [Linum perenne]